MKKLLKLFESFDELYPSSVYKKSEILKHFSDYPRFSKFLWFILQRQYDKETLDDIGVENEKV